MTMLYRSGITELTTPTASVREGNVIVDGEKICVSSDRYFSHTSHAVDNVRKGAINLGYVVRGTMDSDFFEISDPGQVLVTLNMPMIGGKEKFDTNPGFLEVEYTTTSCNIRDEVRPPGYMNDIRHVLRDNGFVSQKVPQDLRVLEERFKPRAVA